MMKMDEKLRGSPVTEYPYFETNMMIGEQKDFRLSPRVFMQNLSKL